MLFAALLAIYVVVTLVTYRRHGLLNVATVNAAIMLALFGAPEFFLDDPYAGNNLRALVLVGAISLAIGSVVGLAPIRRQLVNQQITPSHVAVCRWIIFAIIAYWITFAIVNALQSGSYSLSDLYSFSSYRTMRDDQMQWHQQVQKLMGRIVTPTYYFAIGLVWHASRKSRRLVAVSFVVYAAYFLSSYRGRSELIVLPVVYLLISGAGQKIAGLARILIIAIGCLYALVLLDSVRHDRNISDVPYALRELGRGGEWETVYVLSDLVRANEAIGVSGHASVLWRDMRSLALNVVPRALWSGKPATDFSEITTNALYGHRLAIENWTRTFSIVGQGFCWGGIIGVAALCFFHGVTANLMVRLTWHIPGGQGIAAYIVYCGALNIRNAYTTFLFESVATIGVAYLVSRWLRTTCRTVRPKFLRRQECESPS